MPLIVLILIIFAIFIFPKLFLFVYLVFKDSIDKKNSRLIDIFDFLLFLYLSVILSLMLANRPYFLGKEIGFGEDMLHYYNAFEWVISSSFKQFFLNFNEITSLTGSAEPIFWIIIKLLGLFIKEPYYIHVFLTFLGCLLIYLAGQIWNKQGLLFLFFYTNTITFFAFQGSAVRSGLAFSFAILGYVLFIRNRSKWFQFLSPFVHYSMIPIPIISYSSVIGFKNKRKLFKISFVALIFFSGLIFIGLNSLEAGLGLKVTDRISEDVSDTSSVLQFLFESVFTIIIVFTIFKNIVNKELKISLVLFFILSLLLLMVSPSIFSRFYRYEYFIFIIIYSSIFSGSKVLIKILIMSFSLSWFLYLGFDRFIGVFAEDFFDYINLILI